MFGVRARMLVCLVATAGVSALVACGAGSPHGTPSDSTPAAPVPPTPGATVPATAKALAEQLAAVDAALTRAIHAWRGGGQPQEAPPDAVAVRALYVQRVVRLLARRPRLEAATVRHLPSPVADETRELTVARRELTRLSARWPAQRVATGPPKPLGELLRYYRLAQSRFGIRWQVLAAVNLVESAFGRVRSPSVAGAQGPMQFMPATWRAYGLGGNINDPRDAILGAANLLRHAGAPADYARALYAYNPSAAYVGAVRRYARVMASDQDALYVLYNWKP